MYCIYFVPRRTLQAQAYISLHKLISKQRLQLVKKSGKYIEACPDCIRL